MAGPKLLVHAAYLCAALALGLLAIHFNAGLLPGWTRGLALLAGALALAGAGFAAVHLARHGWTRLRLWPAQAAFALNSVLAVAFAFYVDLT
jgi:hypothetical protein